MSSNAFRMQSDISNFQEERKKIEQTMALNVQKEGKWPKDHREKIIDLIKLAYKSYQEDIEKQINFLHSNLEKFIGKRVQVLIFQRSAV